MQSSNRAFAASVQVRGRPVKQVHFRGRTYIEGRKGTEYTLQFQNTENKRVLVIPSVDGLSVVDGKPAGRKSAGFIVEGRSSIDIPGWVVDNGTAAQFVFWPQDARGEATYVEELYKSGATVDVGNQGLIGFLVLEEHFTPTLKTYGHVSPADQNIWRSAGFDTNDMSRGIVHAAGGGISQNLSMATDSSTAPMGTKFGDATEFNTRTGEFKRGRTVGEIVFEYDTLRGLKDRGVPAHMFKGSDKRYGERSAFPSDVVGCTPPKGWSR